MKSRPLTGTLTALVTPLHRQQVVYEDLRALVEFQVKTGIDGLVPVGSTGESSTLSHEEHMDVVRCTVETAKGRVPVIAGTGSESNKGPAGGPSPPPGARSAGTGPPAWGGCSTGRPPASRPPRRHAPRG